MEIFADNIKIIGVNVNGFRARESQIRKYIMEQGDNCVFALSDTRLKENITVRNIPGYSMLREDREYTTEMATAGGVALLLPQTWTCLKSRNVLSGSNCESITAIIVPVGNGKPFILSAAYNHPGNYIPQHYFKDLKNLMFNGQSLPTLIVGDLNCPHQAFGSRTTNEFGSRLLQTINNENYILLNDGQPTYFSNATGLPNLLDLVLVDPEMSLEIISCITSGDVGSDHLPVVTTLKARVDMKARVGVSLKRWAKLVDEEMESFSVTGHIENDINRINSVFADAKYRCTSQYKPQKRNLPPEIMQNIKIRRTLLKLKKNATSDLVRKLITKQYNQKNHQVQKQLQDFDQAAIESLAEEVCQAKSLSTMWKLLNKHKQNEKLVEEVVSPLICPDGQYTLNDRQKLDEFARHMNSVHQTPDNPMFDNEFKRSVDQTVGEIDTTKSDIKSINPIQINDFKNLLAGTKSKSAAGEDGITYSVLKLCADNTVSKICDVLNQCLEENVFPKQWKSAKVRMLPKPQKDHSKAVSYRPISLLSCLGKILERYIYIYLIKELNGKKFFKDIQAGYSKGRSPQEHLFRLTQSIMNGFKKRDCTVGLFLDVKAAFDSVWKNGLKLKIKKIGLSKQLENLLFSFLDDRVLRIFIEGMWSEIVDLLAGTPQGSCLSPILYLIFVNDATDGLNRKSIDPSQFADDIGIWSSGKTVQETISKIQDGVNALEKWCQKWFVQLNPLKSQLVIFTKCPRHKAEIEELKPTIKLFGQNVPIVAEATYLGVTFDSRLTWEPQFKMMTTKAYKRLNMLRHLSSLSKNPNPNTMIHLYRSIIRPIFEYGSVCTINAAEVHLNKIQILQNQALRAVTKCHKYTSIVDLHDITGSSLITKHLILDAKHRIQMMRKNSQIVEKVIEEYKSVQHIQENASPLDIIANHR